MNCEAFAKLLPQFLDGEASDREAMEVRSHEGACQTCAALSAAETRDRRRLVAALSGGDLPPAFEERVSSLVLREERKQIRGRWLRISIPAAAAALVAVFVLPLARHRHTLDEHGPAVDFAVSRFLRLEELAAERKSTVLDPDILREEAEEVAVLDGPQLIAFYRDLFGDGSKIPDELKAQPAQAAFRKVGFHGTPVSNLILAVEDRKVCVYRLRRDQAALKDLKLIDDGTTSGLRIERCRSCHVIAVTRGEHVFILVSRDGIDPMIRLVRQTF